jgi:hypothetical protein
MCHNGIVTSLCFNSELLVCQWDHQNLIRREFLERLDFRGRNIKNFWRLRRQTAHRRPMTNTLLDIRTGHFYL